MKKIFMNLLMVLIFGSLCFAQAAQLARTPQVAQASDGIVFRYKYAEGDSYRINSTIEESVYFNRKFSHSAIITNRVTIKVSDVIEGENPSDNSAMHTGTFMTSEKNSTGTFSWGREYDSVFRRNVLGIYSIGNEYFMPTVRNVPSFPQYAVKPGDVWSGAGEEVHDLRNGFDLQIPYRVPFSVSYTYKGPIIEDSKTLHIIEAEYFLAFTHPKPTAESPAATRGTSKMTFYWDNELGLCPHYHEDFRIQLELITGDVYEYRGSANAKLTDTVLFDRDKVLDEMNEEVKKLDLKDVHVRRSDEGITISIENIQFLADSARLMVAEKEKIKKLAALLERYPDQELLISGHTALAGTAEGRQELSLARAAAVAQYLQELGVREEYNVYTRGFGAEQPLVPNTSEANRARNRRVEITILEK